MTQIEYRVRPATRYIITRYHSTTDEQGRNFAGVDGFGEFDNLRQANTVACALAKAEQATAYAYAEPAADVTVEAIVSAPEAGDDTREEWFKTDEGVRVYRFYLSPEWPILIPEASLREFNCFPYGPLVGDQETRTLLLRAALHAEEVRNAQQLAI